MQTRDTARKLRSGRCLSALLAAGSLATLAIPASTQAATKFTIVPHFPNHTPSVGEKWVAKVGVTKGKTKLSGSASYEFLFDGSVVGTPKQTGSPYKFKDGVWTDAIIFPSDAAGSSLTLKVMITTKYGTESTTWAVTPKAN